MYKDEIIAEVWRNRDSYAEKHHHSLAEMVADLQVRQKRTECKLQEALGNAEQIIEEWIETAMKLGRPIPQPKGRLAYA